MSTFPIQIDATQLVFRYFVIPGITPDWIDSRTVEALSLEPGPYNFQVAGGFFADFTFRVTSDGTVDYDPPFQTFLEGKGTSKLTVKGFEVILDARYLTGSGVLLVAPLTPADWISYKKCRMVPASFYQVQQGSGVVTSFTFKLELDGNFSYDPSYDISSGGFLAGIHTPILEFLGYPILVDSRAAGGQTLTIQSIWEVPLISTVVQFADLLPAPSFALQVDADLTKAVFSLDAQGIFHFDSSLSDYLELQTFKGLTLLKVKAPLPV